MLKIDFGSGYSPRKGYSTCDITYSPFLDYVYDVHKNEILDLNYNSVDVFYLRNVVHHLKYLKLTLNKLSKYLKFNGIIIIEDCRKEYFKQNVFLDRLWYRYIIPREEIWFSNVYRDYSIIMNELNFKLINKKYKNEKEILVWRKLKKN